MTLNKFSEFRAKYLAATRGGEVHDYLQHAAFDDRADIARLLSGEVVGEKILMPSFDRPSSDRSCVLLIDPDHPHRFHVYACEGDLRKQKRHIATTLKLEESPEVPGPDRKAIALKLWEEGVSPGSTPVESYLRSRCIDSLPLSVRFHPALRHGPSRQDLPAMMALVSDASGHPTGLHRTFLEYGGKAKAAVEPNKMTLGPIGGGAIRLGPIAEHLLVGEGIETTLSAMQATKTSGWSAISAVGMRSLLLPAEVRSVILLVDGDQAGLAAASSAARRWRGEGRRVRLAKAPPGRDFNDLLMEAGRAS